MNTSVSRIMWNNGFRAGVAGEQLVLQGAEPEFISGYRMGQKAATNPLTVVQVQAEQKTRFLRGVTDGMANLDLDLMGEEGEAYHSGRRHGMAARKLQQPEAPVVTEHQETITIHEPTVAETPIDHLLKQNLNAIGTSEVKPAVSTRQKRIEQNGVKAPIKGLCRDVWNALDEILHQGIYPTWDDMKPLIEKNGWNKNNVSSELYWWRKFNGLSMR